MNKNNMKKKNNAPRGRNTQDLSALIRRVDRLEKELKALKREKTKHLDHTSMPENCRLRCASYLDPRGNSDQPLILSTLRLPVYQTNSGAITQVKVQPGLPVPFKFKFSADSTSDGEICVSIKCSALGFSDLQCMLRTEGNGATVRSQINKFATVNATGQVIHYVGVNSLQPRRAGYGTRMALVKDAKLSMVNSQVSRLNQAGGILSGFIPAGVYPENVSWGEFRDLPYIKTFNPKHEEDFPTVRIPVGNKMVNNAVSVTAATANNEPDSVGYMVFYAKGVTTGQSIDFVLEGSVLYFGGETVSSGVEVRENDTAVSCLASVTNEMTQASQTVSESDSRRFASDLPKLMWDSLADDLPLPGPARDFAKKTGDRVLSKWLD